MYSEAKEIWNTLGKDAFTKVRDEEVGVGDGVAYSWSLANDNIISDTLNVYTDGTLVTSSYTEDLDDGKFYFTASSGSEITADYDYADIPDSKIQALISSSDNYITKRTGRNFVKTTGATEYLNRDSKEQNVFFLTNYPIITISEIQIDEGNNEFKTLDEDDYILTERDKYIGMFRLKELPTIGYDKVKVTYDYGDENTPPTIKELSILISIRDMMNSAFYKSMFKGYEFNQTRLTQINDRIEELIRVNKNISFGKV